MILSYKHCFSFELERNTILSLGFFLTNNLLMLHGFSGSLNMAEPLDLVTNSAHISGYHYDVYDYVIWSITV